jgi:hypothetical protein
MKAGSGACAGLIPGSRSLKKEGVEALSSSAKKATFPVAFFIHCFQA